MRRSAAPLAVALAILALAGCGGGGAEPGAPRGATLVLDFQPNAVHSGIYAAKAHGYLEDQGVDLEIREPSSTADGAKLLEAGRTDFAVLDINDLGIARERGLDVVAIAAIVQRPLASVIAADAERIRNPADLAGKTVGVTGVPSDDAVLDTILAEGGVTPGQVERQTIGFQSVALLAAGKIDAATAFWNAEGVELQQQGVPTREFRVDQFGAPRYPELVLAAPGDSIRQGVDPEGTICAVLRGLERGYRDLRDDPNRALDGLLAEVPGTDATAQRAQLAALVAGDAFSTAGKDDSTTALGPEVAAWRRWAVAGGLLEGNRAASGGFRPGLLVLCREAAGGDPG